MCTAVLSIAPGQPLLLAGVRDEFTDRSWEPPGEHWPAWPGIVGGRDLQAGGTWLAVAPGEPRVACVLNGVGQPAPAAIRRSRGELPLLAAAGGELDRTALPGYDPFRLLTAWPDHARLQSWDGRQLAEHELQPGLHVVVNSGLASDLAPEAAAVATAGPAAGRSGLPTPAGSAAEPDLRAQARAHELARIGHFVRRFTESGRPSGEPGLPVAEAWGAWLPLVDGDGLDAHDERALIVRRTFGDGRTWGTTSISLLALTSGWVRYDFTGTPGDRTAWYSVR